MDTDLDTLATAIYVSTDDLLKARPELVPWRPAVGMKPKVSDAEMVTLAVLSALLGFDDEARWVRHVRAQWRHLFPYLPHQPGYNKWLCRLGPVMVALIAHLAADTSVAVDDVLVLDSTPVECARSRDRQTLGPGRLGRVRLLRLPLPLLLGAAPASGVHLAGAADRLRPDRRQGPTSGPC